MCFYHRRNKLALPEVPSSQTWSSLHRPSLGKVACAADQSGWASLGGINKRIIWSQVVLIAPLVLDHCQRITSLHSWAVTPAGMTWTDPPWGLKYAHICLFRCVCLQSVLRDSAIAPCSPACETSGLSHSSELLMYQGILCLLKMHQVYQAVLEFSGLISLNKIACSGMKQFQR